MSQNPLSSSEPPVLNTEQLKQQLVSSFTPDTPQSARARIVEAIIEALNEPEED